MSLPNGASVASCRTITSRRTTITTAFHINLRAPKLMWRITARTIEVFAMGKRIAAHPRNSGNHKYATRPEHMASSHRRFAGLTIDRIHRDAALIGQATLALCALILEHKLHPELQRLPWHPSARQILWGQAT